MNPDRLQQIEDLYHAALGEHTTYRAVFLDQACAGDPALRREVESLLAAHDEADSFIEAPAFEYDNAHVVTNLFVGILRDE